MENLKNNALMIGDVVIYNNKEYVISNITENGYTLNDGDEYIYDILCENIKKVLPTINEKYLFKRQKREIILHQVNCRGVIGSGFAKYVRDTFPGLYMSYNRLCHTHPSKYLLGRVFIYNYQNYIILNMFSQLDYGYKGKVYTDYDAMENALKYIRNKFPTEKITAPKYIGCDRGGGDWNIVSKLLEKYNISTSTNIVFNITKDDKLLDRHYRLMSMSTYGRSEPGSKVYELFESNRKNKQNKD